MPAAAGEARGTERALQTRRQPPATPSQPGAPPLPRPPSSPEKERAPLQRFPPAPERFWPPSVLSEARTTSSGGKLLDVSLPSVWLGAVAWPSELRMLLSFSPKAPQHHWGWGGWFLLSRARMSLARSPLWSPDHSSMQFMHSVSLQQTDDPLVDQTLC